MVLGRRRRWSMARRRPIVNPTLPRLAQPVDRVDVRLWSEGGCRRRSRREKGPLSRSLILCIYEADGGFEPPTRSFRKTPVLPSKNAHITLTQAARKWSFFE